MLKVIVMRRLASTTVVLVLAVIALVAAVSLCAFALHEDASDLHGCLPLVVTTLSALAVMPILMNSGATLPLIPAPERSIFLDTTAPPPKRRRLA